MSFRCVKTRFRYQNAHGWKLNEERNELYLLEYICYMHITDSLAYAYMHGSLINILTIVSLFAWLSHGQTTERTLQIARAMQDETCKPQLYMVHVLIWEHSCAVV